MDGSGRGEPQKIKGGTFYGGVDSSDVPSELPTSFQPLLV